MNFREVKEKALSIIGKKTRQNAKSPVKNFEKEYNVSNLSDDYSSPNGYETLKDFEISFYNEYVPFYALDDCRLSIDEQDTLKNQYYNSNILGKIKQVYSTFTTKNPQLKEVKIDKNNFNQVFDLIYGACSGYNVKDIDFFINNYDQEQVKKQRKFEEKMTENKANKLGVKVSELRKEDKFKFGWILSADTFDEALLKLNKKSYKRKEVKLENKNPLPSRRIYSEEEEYRLRMGYMHRAYSNYG